MKTLLILFLAVCLTASEVHRPDDDCVRKSHNSATSTWTSEDGSGDGLSDHLHEEVTTYDDEDHDESVSAGRSTRKICKSNGDNAHSRSSHKTAVMESDPLEDNEETHDVDHADDSESSESDARIDNDEFTVADTDEKHDFDHSHAYDSTQDDLDIIGAASEKVADWGTEVDGRERSERRDEDKCHAPTKEIVGVPISRKSVEARRGPSAKRDGGEDLSLAAEDGTARFFSATPGISKHYGIDVRGRMFAKPKNDSPVKLRLQELRKLGSRKDEVMKDVVFRILGRKKQRNDENVNRSIPMTKNFPTNARKDTKAESRVYRTRIFNDIKKHKMKRGDDYNANHFKTTNEDPNSAYDTSGTEEPKDLNPSQRSLANKNGLSSYFSF